MKVKWRNNSKFELGNYGSCAMHSKIFQQSCILDCFSTIMHIRFEDVQAVDDKVIFQTNRKCCKNFNQMEITYRQDEVELWFFHTALGIIETNTNAKFQISQTGNDKFKLRTKKYSKELSNSMANNSVLVILV